MVDSVAARVRGCCGSRAEMRLDGEPIVGVCSHPDLAQLSAGLRPGASPTDAIVGDLVPIRIQDTLADQLWPEFSLRALQHGIRSVHCAAHPIYDGVLTLTLYSLRPGGLPDDLHLAVHPLLQQWADNLTRAAAYAVARTEAHHLGEAIAAKEVVEQAKGMLMQALRCDAETAYAQLQSTARRAKIRTVDVARRMTERGELGSRRDPGWPLVRQRPPTGIPAV